MKDAFLDHMGKVGAAEKKTVGYLPTDAEIETLYIDSLYRQGADLAAVTVAVESLTALVHSVKKSPQYLRFKKWEKEEVAREEREERENFLHH